MFARPLGEVLKGLCFEGSDFDKTSFYVNYFVTLLCVPTKFLLLFFSDRLRIEGGARWDTADPNMIMRLNAAVHRDALPYLSRVHAARDICEVAKLHPNPNDPYVLQSVAYASARSSDFERATTQLEQLMGVLDMKISWQREMWDRAKKLRGQIVENRTLALEQLQSWEMETIKSLGLEAFR